MNHDDLDKFQNDVADLAEKLRTAFSSDQVLFSIHESSETLYVQIKDLDKFTNQEINLIANPILDNNDLDFEVIILSPIL